MSIKITESHQVNPNPTRRPKVPDTLFTESEKDRAAKVQKINIHIGYRRDKNFPTDIHKALGMCVSGWKQ